MSEKPIQPWIAANSYMQDEYRETLVDLALQHLPHASKDLRAFAKRELSKAITIPGFRSAHRAPVNVIRPYVVGEFERIPGVATAVICLWAEAEQKLINGLQVAAEAERLQFHPDWSWQEASGGFYVFEDIAPLRECAEALAQDKSSPEADHLQLAALWLSRALISKSSDIATADSSLQPQETVADEDQVTLPEEEPDTPDMPALEEPLPVQSESLQERVVEADQARQASVSESQTVLAAIEASDLEEAEAQLVALQNALAEWKSKRSVLGKVVQQAVIRLANELEARPDLKLDASTSALLGEEEATDIVSEKMAKEVLSAIERVLDYDRTKQDTLSQLGQVRAGIVELHEDIAEWIEDELPDIQDLLHSEEEEITLSEVRAILEHATAEQQKLANRRLQLRELSLSNISTLIGSLQELELPTDTRIRDDLTLGALSTSSIADLSSRQLSLLEQTLVDLVNEQTMKAKAAAPETLAGELKSDWDEKKLLDLLDRLAREKRDTEALLLLLGANTTHPRTKTISLARPVVSSLLRGIGQLSRKVHPFELLNLLAADFLNGWEAADHASQAELCLVFMAAQYGGERRLPNGFLWQLPGEWPVQGMPNWSKLWQSSLRDEPLSVVMSAEDNDGPARLEQARSHAEQMLAREHGSFVRLRSLKSKGLRKLIRNDIMPGFLSQLATLQKMEQNLHSSGQPDSARLLTQLERLLTGELAEALHEDALIETYEARAVEAGIDDSDPFHRRTALRILRDCAESILDYGKTLMEFWHLKLQHEASVTRESLQTELTMLPELTPLGQAALEQIVQAAGSELVERDKDTARAQAFRQLVHELLSQTTYALRLPRVVGYLTGARLDWMELLGQALDDLTEPMDATGAAELLMEQEAPNQVLLLTQNVSLDIQKQAQSLKGGKERQTDELQIELLKVGGSAEGLSNDRELGRWRLVHRELVELLAEYQTVHKRETQRVQDRARQLRQAINELDLAIFESEGTMPADVYRLVEQGLNLARKATGTEALFGQVEAYLREIRYRLERQSWPLTETQSATDQLKRAVDGQSVDRDVAPGVEEVLDLLERGELRQLDLDPDDVTTSEVGTRCDLLRNWLSVRALPTLMSENLKAADRTAIQALIRYFARMVVMKRTRAPDGKPIAYEYPAVYSYWELQYPRTAVLERPCVLIALPGQPPSAKDLSQLEYLMEEKEWLDYFFVILFVPGCTPDQYKRLQSRNPGLGLVIINESAILDMILAGTESNHPLGRLRPLMLNALGAENVDVFTINQLVNSRTAIFVGRDALVDRIASSGDNYALYGGRRIGKSSVLKAVEDRLERRGTSVVFHSFEGENCSDDASAMKLAQLLRLDSEVRGAGDFKLALQAHLDANPDLNLVLLLDEVDKYIILNPTRHVLIETLRALSDQYGSRFRVVVAGFMSLYDCLQGRGPYTPTSDPWRRMLNDIGPLENLRPASAEQIVREGFIGILGWKLENRAIPQRIVELTGGHPAFVQHFCMRLQQRAGRRGDRLVRLEDVEAVFADRDPEQSFIAYVEKTLELNLDSISRYLILWLAAESSEAQGFTLDQMRELASLSRSPIPEDYLLRSLELLSVTSVVKARAPEVYDFSVPDYPLILNQLGETAHLEHLEDKLEKYLMGGSDVNI